MDVSPAPTALIESIIQINKAYKCAILSKKIRTMPQTPLGSYQHSLKPLS